MYTKRKQMNCLDLWKLYHLGVFEFDNLHPCDQREILNFDECMKIIIPDEDLEIFYDTIGEVRMEECDFRLMHLTKVLAKRYGVDHDTMKIRMKQYAREKQIEREILEDKENVLQKK